MIFYIYTFTSGLDKCLIKLHLQSIINVEKVSLDNKKLISDILLTTTEAKAESSPLLFMADTRYWAVSSKSHLQWQTDMWHLHTDRTVTWTSSTQELMHSKSLRTLYACHVSIQSSEVPKLMFKDKNRPHVMILPHQGQINYQHCNLSCNLWTMISFYLECKSMKAEYSVSTFLSSYSLFLVYL